jgi:hypothetical protein
MCLSSSCRAGLGRRCLPATSTGGLASSSKIFAPGQDWEVASGTGEGLGAPANRNADAVGARNFATAGPQTAARRPDASAGQREAHSCPAVGDTARILASFASVLPGCSASGLGAQSLHGALDRQ